MQQTVQHTHTHTLSHFVNASTYEICQSVRPWLLIRPNEYIEIYTKINRRKDKTILKRRKKLTITAATASNENLSKIQDGDNAATAYIHFLLKKAAATAQQPQQQSLAQLYRLKVEWPLCMHCTLCTVSSDTALF